jgi:hypothetical protein
MQFMINLGITEISILLIALTFVQVWVNELPMMLGKELIPFKPFNCDACLSWWVGLILSIALQNPIFFILYLMNSIYNRIKL